MRISASLISFLLAAMLAGAAAHAAPPDEPPPGGTPAVDRPAGDPPAAPRARPPAVLRQRGGGEDVGGGPEEPLAAIARQMAEVGNLLRADNTSVATQQRQREIVDELGALIDRLQQQPPSPQDDTAQQAEPGAAPAGSDPGDAAVGAPPSVAVTADDMTALWKKVWGHLPDRVQQQIQAPWHEEYLPAYDRVIREYYQRLAENQGRP